MSLQTRIPQVIDAVVAGLRATSGFRAPLDTVSTPGLVTVFDGAEVRATDDAIDTTFLVIGWSGDGADELEAAATSSLAAGPIAAANRPRDELASINCKAISHRGESSKLARDGAFAAVSAAAAFCRADPSLGINTSDTIGGVRTSAWVIASTLIQYQSNGYVAEVSFSVNYASRV